MNHQMGDLPGHVFPGLAFLAWAVLWTIVLCRRGGAAISNPWDARPDAILGADAAASVGWEAWAKIVIPLVEMTGELRWVTWPMTEASTTIYAHITVDFAVMLSGAVDLLVARGRLPKGADHVALALAFFVAGVLFAAHGQHGPIAGTAHALFAKMLFAAAALVLVEHFRPAPMVRWGRIYAVALAGVWFVHTGWMLYVADYDLMSEALVPRTYLFFTWYAITVLVVLQGALAAQRPTAAASPSR